MKKFLQIMLSVCLLGAAGFIIHQRMNAPVPGDEASDALWVCTSPGCHKEFRTTRAATIQNLQVNPDGAMPCPGCGKSLTVRGFECPSCKRAALTTGHGEVPRTCPHCKAAMLTENASTPRSPG